MKLATYLRGTEHAPRVGAAVGSDMLDLAAALALDGASSPPDVSSMRALLAAGEGALDTLRSLLGRVAAAPSRFDTARVALREVTFLPPVPDAEKFLCVGKNYRAHLEELKRTDLIRETPQEPTAFVKLNSCLTGHDSDVVRPVDVAHLDYEPEMVFVLGRHADRVARGDALSYVAGITLLNDLTCRDTQKREVASGSRFWTSKNAPGFGPLGPWIVTLDEVPDPYDLWVTCSVNGEQRMRVNTADQIWKIDDILPHFSRLVPLAPGDMFATGAPGGVAVGRANAEALFLKPGDVVECAFEAPAMTLRNRIVAPS